ncbi:LamG domain-containing protein [Lentzea sp. BCCO 10_0856]|uniref:LamG domain-containing protein n=1 Tax=Lentzea miocenica TaxID=3095431 RepID=A0ABU4T9F6_9PSEU|nr:LamG domain-containing protein [Lentzea sp. BCCO 10_0856]MDX8034803.1 LamG domain-containing protein [Lentzea sp. BCCO 10_0856]
MSRRSATRHARARVLRVLCVTVAVAASGLGGLPAAQAGLVGPLSAEAKAAATGEPVEVVSETTERSRVFANPDGTRRLETRPQPVRVKKNDSWVAIDTSLHKRTDGAVEPKAATPDVVFSGGGKDAPLVRMAKGDKNIALTWPKALPAPKLDGDSATYAEVEPGIDLVLHAKPDGFSQVLVVKNKEAASNSILHRVKLGAQVNGLKLGKDEAGNLKVADDGGNAVFTSASPLMWDSSGKHETQPGSTSKGPAAGAKQAFIDAVVGADTVEVIPDQTMLTASDTVYPVYVDPPLNAGRVGGTELWGQAPEDPNWNNWFEGVARVGRETGADVKVRSVWAFDVAALRGKVIKTALFTATRVSSFNCNLSWVKLWRTSPVSAVSNWNNVSWPNELDGTDRKCAGTNGFDFNAFAAVDAVSKESNTTQLSLGLRAVDETSNSGWRKFDPNPVLNVTYNSRPDAPSELKVEGVDCAIGDARPFIHTVDPTFSARLRDMDGSENPILNARFYWGFVGSGDQGSAGVGNVPNGEIASVKQAQGTFVHGGKYGFSAAVGDNYDSSDRSNFCEFEVDTARPDRPPLITSTDFPSDDDFHGFAGTNGSFTLEANNVADVKGFYYGYENPPVNYVAADKLGGKATVSVTARYLGRNTLYVQSVDRAGNVNVAQPVAYRFQTDQQRPSMGRWLLDGNGDDIADNPHPLAASSTGVTWIAGRDGEAAQLSRAQRGTLSTPDVGVDSDKSFSVAAWVKLDQKGDWFNVVSQDGNRNSTFVLQYSHSLDKWAFNTPNADADFAGESWVASTRPAEAGVWTRLIGVYDAATGEIKLYVNGVYQGASKRQTPWDANGAIVVGRGKQNGNPTSYLGGGVDDVVIYDRALVAEDIAELSNRPAVMEAHWAFEEASQQGPQTKLNAGASWVAGRAGQERNALALNGDKGHLSTATSVVRTDQSFSVAAWAKLDRKGSWFNAVSQDGSRNSGFVLQYSHTFDKWAFDMPNSDSDQAPETWVNSQAAAQTGVWTHLVGVYDHTAQQMRLYVNGTAAGSASKVSNWNAGGNFQVGRGRNSGADVGYFPGTAEGVQAYPKALTPAEVTALHQGNTPAGAGFILSSAGKLAAEETGDHPATLLGGASLGDGSLTLDGDTGYATSAGPVVRTDQSFSVAARVLLDRTNGYLPILTQSGAHASGFYLEYSKDAGTFVFSMLDQDRLGPTEHLVVAVDPVTTGQEVHLAAVYDASAGELRIYLNGEPQGAPGTHTSNWHASGSVLIGQGKYNDGLLDEFPGKIYDARLYQGVLTPFEIKMLATG